MADPAAAAPAAASPAAPAVPAVGAAPVAPASPGAGLLSGQPPAASPATPASPAAPAGDAAAWYGETYKDLVALKKWGKPDDVLQSYQTLETLVGADKIAVPTAADDQAVWDATWNRLGRPAAPADYKLPVPEGDDGKFAAAMAPVLHKAGLTQRQAETLATAWNEMQTQQTQAAVEARAAEDRSAIAGLQKEWGQDYERNMELGRRAFRQFAGAEDAALIDRVEQAVGAAGLVKLFARIGTAMGIGGLEGGAPQAAGFGTGPQAAQTEITRLKADKAFMDVYLYGTGKAHADAVEKMNNLQKIAAGVA